MSKKKYTYNYPGFMKSWKRLPNGITMVVRAEIMQACGWTSRGLFNYKRAGDRPLKDDERESVEYILGKYGLEASTGRILDLRKYLDSTNQKQLINELS